LEEVEQSWHIGLPVFAEDGDVDVEDVGALRIPGRSLLGPGFSGRVEVEVGRVVEEVEAGGWSEAGEVRDEDARLKDANEASRSETLFVEAQNFM
jgi:hypothetical protein